MKRRMKMILMTVGAAILILVGLLYLYLYWVILPVNSSSHTLTLVKYGYPNPKRITLRHYVDGEHVNDYVLELKEGLRYQMPQSYGLPELKEGMAEVVVELENRVDGSDGSIKVNYEKANNLYKMGLLLYFDTDYNQYVHFVSGNERIVYFEKDDSPDWSLIMDAPSPKRFTPAGMEYAPLFDSNWKEENKWVAIPAKSEINSEEELLNKVNHAKKSEDLIHYHYPEELLLQYNKKGICFEDVNCEIECLRKIDDETYYAILRSNNKSTLYLLFEKSDHQFKSTDCWYVRDDMNKSGFESLIVNQSNLDDVRQIDPYAFYLVDHTGRTDIPGFESNHLTADGYEVTVCYEAVFEEYSISDLVLGRSIKGVGDYLVSQVDIKNAGVDSMYGKLLEIDKK